jgi:hypothetical protein
MIATILTPHRKGRPSAFWITRNNPLGFAEHHAEKKNSEKLDKKNLSRLLQEVSINSIQQNKYHLWTKQAKMKHISKHTSVYLPTTNQDSMNSSSNILILSVWTRQTWDMKEIFFPQDSS